MSSKVIIDIIANDKASGITSGITSTLTKLSTALLAIGTAGAAAFLALGKQALDATAEYERLTLSIESLAAREIRAADSTLTMTDALVKAAPATKELLGWVQKLAIESPFDQQGIAQALQMGMNFGFTTEEAKRLTENLVDLTAATGRGTYEMTNIARALGQVKGRGRLMAQEINQLTEGGVNVIGILQNMGYTLDDVSKGLVSADEFLEAFNLTMEDEVGGAAKRATQSWGGLISTLGDLKKLGLRTMFAETFEVLQPLVAKFAEWLQSEEGIKRLEEIGAAMGDITQSVVDMFSAMRGMSLSDIISGIGEGAVAMTEGFKKWAEGIDWNEISNQIADGIASIDWATLGEQVRISATNIFDGIKIAVEETDWSAVFGSITDAFLDFAAGLTSGNTWEEVENAFKSDLDSIKTIVSEFDLTEAAATAFGGIGLSIGVLIDTEWVPEIEQALIRLKETFKANFDDMIDASKRVLEERAGEIKQAVADLIELAKGAIEPLTITLSTPNFEEITSRVEEGLDNIMEIGEKTIKPFILTVVQPLWEFLKEKVEEGATKIYEAGKKALKSISVTVGLPNWDKLVSEIEEGMAMINAALKGSSKGAKGSNAMGGGGSAGGKKAMGGRIDAGTPTLVGERGAEIFVPDTGGRIIPNYKLGASSGGNIIVNLTYAPAFSTVDQYELQERLSPFIERGIRNVQRGTA